MFSLKDSHCTFMKTNRTDYTRAELKNDIDSTSVIDYLPRVSSKHHALF